MDIILERKDGKQDTISATDAGGQESFHPSQHPTD